MSKILVVDDELNICELLKLYLENEATRCLPPTTAKPL